MYINVALQAIGAVKTVQGLIKGGGDEQRNGGAGTKTETNSPWAAADPYLRQNLQDNANLQKFYQQNPFSAQQKTGYQNQNNTIDQFNGQVAPGLLGMANSMMGQDYHRQRGGAPGSGAGYGGDVQSAGMQPTPQGLLSGPFSAPQHQNFGQIDWNAMNPYSDQNKNDPRLKAATDSTIPVTQDNFDESAYMAANPDLAANGWDRGGWDHYINHGKQEGRKFTPRG